MREPRSWNDTRPLEEEPFLTEFSAWWWQGGRNMSSIKERRKRFTSIVKADADAEKAARVWSDMAFTCSKNTGRRPANFIEIFGEYYWISFLDRQTKKNEATLYLNKQRRLANCYYEIQVEMENQETSPSQTSTQTPRVQSTEQVLPSKSHPVKQAKATDSQISQSSVSRVKAGPSRQLPSLVTRGDTSKILRSPPNRGKSQLNGTAVDENVPGMIQTKHGPPSVKTPSILAEPMASLCPMNSDQGLLATNRSPQPVWSGLDPVHGATDSLSATKDDISGSYTTYRPPLPFHPPIWAQSRQELCESFDWFRSYQGGVYHANNAVKGYLLSAFPASRDCFEHAGKLIISHGGGKAECLHTHKGHVAADDQLAQDKSVRALLTTYYECRPLVLVIDDKYTLFPYDLGTKDITYAILGFYTIVAAWAEYQPAHNERGRVVRYKFAFRWCESQGQPWWGAETDCEGIARPEPAAISAVSRSRRMPVSVTDDLGPRQLFERSDQNYLCSACGASSPHIYTQGWACLNTECSAFWKTKNGSGLPDELAYRDEFLRLLASLKVSPILDDLFSPTVPYDKEVNANTGYTFSRGWHCRGCGRLSCRVKMEHWECSSCQAVHSITGRVRCAQEFWQEIPSINFRDFLIWEQSEVQRLPQRLFKSSLDTGHVQSFILPNGWGVIHHIQHSTEAGRRSADDVFEEYQHQANAGELPFRRWPLRSHKLRGPMLTNYFSQNCGEPYQYVGGTANTLPFSKAPSAVLSARKLIQTRIEAALAQSVDFNEVLSAAYMERQRMAFHSDSERGLGPVVAGLSLGAPAVMHFRLHAKYELEQDQRNIALSIVLRHGDVLVMEGLQIQEHYEHTVVPTNYRIAATARWIDPERHL